MGQWLILVGDLDMIQTRSNIGQTCDQVTRAQGPGLDKCVQCEEISVETDITQYIGFITKYG